MNGMNRQQSHSPHRLRRSLRHSLVSLRWLTIIAVLGSLGVARAAWINGEHPEYQKHQGQEHSSVATPSGVYGAFRNDDRLEADGVAQMEIVYQHYTQPCDTRRCTGLSFERRTASPTLASAPGYAFQGVNIALRLETAALERSAMGKKRFGTAYLGTSYIVIMRSSEGKRVYFFEGSK